MSHPLSLEQLTLAYQNLALPIAIFAQDGSLIAFNLAFSQQVPEASQFLQHQADSLIFPVESGHQNWTELLNDVSKNSWQGEVRFAHSDGHSQPQGVSISTMLIADSQPGYVLSLLNAVSLHSTTQNLAQLAYKDSLTGLANRSLFFQLFDHEIQQAQRLNLRFAVLFIDLDKFKQVNDNLGHDVGDALLSAVAQRMQQSFRKSDVIARLGGDEFAVIMNNIKDSDTVAKVTEKMIRELSKPVKSGSHVVDVSCSVGISVYPDNASSAEELLQHADAAMYRAKHNGGRDYCFFSDALNQELLDFRQLERQMVEGLKQHQFVPYFQPVLDKRSGTLVGVECLARWISPQQGVMSALEFIPIALKTGLIQPVFEQILDQAFTQLIQWRASVDFKVPLSLNISSKQFYQQQTFDMIERLMQKHKLSADSIRIEVTESTLQESGPGLIEQLQRVQSAGFSITLDDFGTGYSSLRYLQQLPVEILKIDRSFVRNLDNNPHDRVIVKAIIQLADTLDIQSVAEGVESEQQATFLAENGCYVMQGYLFSPALDSVSFSDYLHDVLKISA